MTTYIYTIKCLYNDKTYVGKSTNPRSRKAKHLNDLKSGRHTFEFQKDYNLFGKNAFIMEVVDSVVGDENEIAKKEFQWISKFNSIKNGYNLDNPINPGEHRKKRSYLIFNIKSNSIEAEDMTVDQVSKYLGVNFKSVKAHRTGKTGKWKIGENHVIANSLDKLNEYLKGFKCDFSWISMYNKDGSFFKNIPDKSDRNYMDNKKAKSIKGYMYKPYENTTGESISPYIETRGKSKGSRGQNGKSVACKDTVTKKVVHKFASIKDAAAFIGSKKALSQIGQRCRGFKKTKYGTTIKTNTYKGYIWEYSK